MKPKFKFYATLLDAFQSYIDRAELYQKYYGFAENPACSETEWDLKMERELIDKINRLPFESGPADKGTAFNEVVDCSIEKRKSEKYIFKLNADVTEVTASNDKYNHVFPIEICKEFADYFRDALTQQRVSGIIETCYGYVEVYGVIDELMPLSIHDIKTTSKYESFKYKNNWQHIVYPFCTGINDFEYNITDFKDTYTEKYVFDIERDTERLKKHCEHFIGFLYLNENLITDKKIFNN